MTCIVAVVEDGIVHMVGDSGSCAWGGADYQVRKDPKVFRLGEAVVGFTTSWRMGQVLRYEMKLPEVPEGIELHEYMVRCFVPRLREAAKAAGIVTVKENVEQLGRFMVGLRGRLFVVDYDFQVGELVADYHAVGSGAEVALGALHATRGQVAQGRLVGALHAAVAHIQAIKPPFIIASTATSDTTVSSS